MIRCLFTPLFALFSRALCCIGVHDWRNMDGVCVVCGYEDPYWVPGSPE